MPGFEGFGGLGGFGSPFGIAPPPPPAGGAPTEPLRPWRITPSLGVELLATDNVEGSGTNRRADLITTLAPALTAEANLARLTGRLSYAPLARFYAETRGRNGIDHLFSGQALATLLEESLFLDLRGFGGLQAIEGGFAPEGSPVTDRRNQAQTVSLQASPYLMHRFGGLATMQLGYSYQYFQTDGDSAFLPGATQPFFVSQETTSHTGYAVIRTGEDFGRFALESRTVGTAYESDGVLDGAHRFITTLQARYSLVRGVAVLVEGGYEDQRYRGTQPLTIQGPVWAVGARLAPDPDSVIIIKYGRRDGFESPYLSANFGLGVRTRVFATYSEDLGTAAMLATDLLTSATLDERGNLVDSATGAPVLAPFGGSLLATQSSLMRQKRGTIGISQSWLRDTVTLSASYDDRTPVTSAPGTVGFAQKGWSVGLSWGRMLTPSLSGTASVEYGRTESSSTAVGDGDFYGFGVGLTQELTPGLLGYVRYAFSNRDSGFTSGSRGPQNVVALGLRWTLQ